MVSSVKRSRKDGIAINVRIRTGTTVQSTSNNVLWVVLEGTGLALALNLTMTTTSKPRTKRVMQVMITTNTVWNQWIWLITSVAAGCKLISQGCGWAASARLVARLRKITGKAINRLNTCIVVIAPSTRNNRP